MGRSAQPSPPVDLEVLDAYLNSEKSPAGSMGLSDLDGFLTGLVVGPEVVRPAEWMKLVWGEDEPEFETPEHADAVLGTIMARYNEISIAWTVTRRLSTRCSGKTLRVRRS